jgi:hypothetical protein
MVVPIEGSDETMEVWVDGSTRCNFAEAMREFWEANYGGKTFKVLSAPPLNKRFNEQMFDPVSGELSILDKEVEYWSIPYKLFQKKDAEATSQFLTGM